MCKEKIQELENELRLAKLDGRAGRAAHEEEGEDRPADEAGGDRPGRGQ